MKRSLLLCGLVLTAVVLQARQDALPRVAGPYFGQKPPGRAPERFAPEIFNPGRYSWYHSVIVFSPDGREAFWNAGLAGSDESGLFTSRLSRGHWTEPRLFQSLGASGDCPAFSPDGKRLFFIAQGPSPDDRAGRRKENIWVSERSGDGWADPTPLPRVINSLDLHWQISVDRHGSLYFGVWKVDPATDRTLEHDIYVSRLGDGGYSTPTKLGREINDPSHRQYSPYVSPGGDYVIFTRTPRNPPFKTTIQISFRNAAGGWSASRDLSEIIGMPASNATVTRDGKFLFFLKAGLEVYWMDATFIREMRAN